MSELSSSSDAGSHGAPSPDGSTASTRLKFSIDNILQPNFGAKSNITNDPADLLLPSAFFGLPNKRAKLKKAALQRSTIVPPNVYGRVNLAADQLARSFPRPDDFRFLAGST
ncbi:hypothetical protein M3Y99_00499600 [Aphelenchoides fujianensis]|nr:hypothetical protein M3Y99_00499600 [Aphelenchoides fujianensis]